MGLERSILLQNMSGAQTQTKARCLLCNVRLYVQNPGMVHQETRTDASGWRHGAQVSVTPTDRHDSSPSDEDLSPDLHKRHAVRPHTSLVLDQDVFILHTNMNAFFRCKVSPSSGLHISPSLSQEGCLDNFPSLMAVPSLEERFESLELSLVPPSSSCPVYLYQETTTLLYFPLKQQFSSARPDGWHTTEIPAPGRLKLEDPKCEASLCS